MKKVNQIPKQGNQAFTLIELLIVVAIIAILAAIAVPNFLEAQVRSKVARVMSDMRSVGVAIEEYSVDYNMPPMGRVTLKNYYPTTIGLLNANLRDEVALSRVTTPVSYISSIPRDVFGETLTDQNGKKRTCFVYLSHIYKPNAKNEKVYELGYTWSIHTRGPSQLPCNAGYTLLGQWDHIGINAQGLTVTAQPYDSSNGTVSQGVIIRTNKGQYSGREASSYYGRLQGVDSKDVRVEFVSLTSMLLISVLPHCRTTAASKMIGSSSAVDQL